MLWGLGMWYRATRQTDRHGSKDVIGCVRLLVHLRGTDERETSDRAYLFGARLRAPMSAREFVIVASMRGRMMDVGDGTTRPAQQGCWVVREGLIGQLPVLQSGGWTAHQPRATEEGPESFSKNSSRRISVGNNGVEP